MHTLVNTFVSKSEVITVEGGKALYPILVSLPPRYSRTIYFETLENQEKWLVILKQISQTKLDASGGAVEKPDAKSADKKVDDKDAGAKK